MAYHRHSLPCRPPSLRLADGVHAPTHAHVRHDCCVWLATRSYFAPLWCDALSPCTHQQENKEPAAVTSGWGGGGCHGVSGASIVCGVISSVVLLPLCWPGLGPFITLPARVLRLKLQPTRWRLSAGLQSRPRDECCLNGFS